MATSVKFPFYAKWSLLILGFFFLISMLIIAQGIILPLIYAIIIAILISPVVNFLERKGLNRGVAIGAVLGVALGAIITLVVLLASQADLLIEAMPQLTKKLQEMLHQTALWASDYFNISVKKINKWFEHEKENFLQDGQFGIGSTLMTLGSVLSTIFLTPVYIFMILFYQDHLLEFIHKLFGAVNDKKVDEILSETKFVIEGYLVGLFSEFVIIAILNSLGLLILGIDYAIILGILGALLNVIPYVGGLVAVLIFMTIALLTKAPIYVLYVMSLYLVIQFVDNNYIVPKIVGSKVRLNALISILAVVGGAALWGIPGMFLSIPLMAVIKLVADRIEPLKPYGFLLGDTKTPLMKLRGRKTVAKT